jgi:hypothetical protein
MRVAGSITEQSHPLQDPTTNSREDIEKNLESLNTQIVEKFREMLE